MNLQKEQKVSTKLEKEVKNLTKLVTELKTQLTLGDDAPLGMEEAAAFTGRCRRKFQSEYHKGLWTSINVGGTGHPKFTKADLKEDMRAWRKISSFREMPNG